MLYGFREREMLLDIFEIATGLRMNHAYFRIGGVLMDIPAEGEQRARDFLDLMPGRIQEYEDLLASNPIWIERNRGVGVLSAADALALGVTGPVLRAAGVPRDVRKGRALLRLRDLRVRRRHAGTAPTVSPGSRSGSRR